VRDDYDEPSVFQPEALLREARRQRQLPDVPVPAVCLLDPDGDIVRYLRAAGRAGRHPGWACYHTELDRFELGAREVGIVGRAVGAPFAVVVAEQLRVSGCELVISMTSAGRVAPPRDAEFILIERAIRDEGTSVHYLPADREALLRQDMAERLASAFRDLPFRVAGGVSWTTDAPYRETQSALDRHAAAGVSCVEMEAAGLYAYAEAKAARVVCVAHLTNEMARGGEDYEKGPHDGAEAALAVAGRIADLLAD
jgi:uridine phosphorylase